MSRAMDRHVGGLLALLAGGLLAVVGCSSSGTGDKKTPTLNVSGGDGQKPDSSKKGNEPAKPTAPEFVGNYLKALGESKASADLLTPAFKKKIARPDHNDAEQQKLGYNPRKVEAFLQQAGAGRPETLDMAQAASGPFFFGPVKTAGGGTERCLIRLVPTSDATGWQIDWLQRTTAKGPSCVEANPGPELIGVTLVAHEFLENLLGGDLTLAEAAMSKKLKIEEALPPAESEKEQGYNSSSLHNIRMKGWRNGFTEFTFTKRDPATGTFEGELTDAAKKEKKTFTLKVGKSEGDWLVEEFKVQ